MIRRIPLWATLLPLVLGVVVWALVWRGYARDFEDDLARAVPAAKVEAGGFPYRLEARIAPIDIGRDTAALRARVRATEGSVNRVPWQRDRQVLNLSDPVVDLALAPLTGATVRIAAPGAQASLRLEGATIGRLSVVWETPNLKTGLLPVPITADRLEAHLREPAVPAAAAAGSPTLPVAAQLVLLAKDLRLGAGDPLNFQLDAGLTAADTIRSYAGWAGAGTVEIGSATLSDRTGEVAKLQATLVPDGAGALRIAGTIETVCPANVRAAIAGLPPVSERRLRRAERIAVLGTLPGDVRAAPRDPTRPSGPVRGQEPPCPRLR